MLLVPLDLMFALLICVRTPPMKSPLAADWSVRSSSAGNWWVCLCVDELALPLFWLTVVREVHELFACLFRTRQALCCAWLVQAATSTPGVFATPNDGTVDLSLVWAVY